jgi:hypothetical protein
MNISYIGMFDLKTPFRTFFIYFFFLPVFIPPPLCSFGTFLYYKRAPEFGNPRKEVRTIEWLGPERDTRVLYYHKIAYKSWACFFLKFCVVFPVQVRASLCLIIYLSQNLQFVSSFLNRSPPLSLRAHPSCWITFYAETSPVKLFLVTLSVKTSNCCGIIPHICTEDCFSIREVLTAIGQ